MKIGVLRFSALGDLALALPFIRALKVKPIVLTMPPGQALLSDEFESFVTLKDKSVSSHIRFILALRRGTAGCADRSSEQRPQPLYYAPFRCKAAYMSAPLRRTSIRPSRRGRKSSSPRG